MSYAFRRHDYNLNDFERCPEHGCVMMQVQDLPPVCLIEWLLEKAAERTVRDVILREQGEYDLPAVILDNGFLLPVEQVIRVRPAAPTELTLEEVAGWYVADILSMPGKDAVAVELLPPGAVVDEEPGILLQLSVDILLYLLFDQEIRKVEP
ncbi:hypothetical protein [Anaerolinea thermophila]|uniref:Uncharacterized protein n=1 Tax=Anaerolinea thermophila (strain DSM 14523 / JCM 11388 / NBRC 100420 / UNI-1) TaxID=926569 RepID=E8MYW7_ANATU|nr:hypothetical protein [Anaerolinea thermophila]BAJ64453.1 hypothetical protein ANT_24270 [Anaerolinea thermophila UNI-1]